MPYDGPGVINVRFAGYRQCYPDTRSHTRSTTRSMTGGCPRN
jgi:hypothetical protein